MSKSKKIRITFCGQNATDVTGSCTHIQTEHNQILIECGLYQSCSPAIDDYKVNSEKLPYKPKEITYIFALHNHIDHIGKLPLLYKKGCQAKIIAPINSKGIAEILLRDCAHINGKDSESFSRISGKDYKPLFTDEDVDTCLSYWCEFPFDEKIELDENVTFNLSHSGHILNSSQLELWLKNKNTTKKIAYTSDIGNISIPKYYAQELTKIKKCDLLIAESTYCGEKSHFDFNRRDKEMIKIKDTIESVCIEKGGRILFPVFANDRCQNILTCIYDIFGNDPHFNIPVLVDSPMAVKICQEYKRILDGEDAKKIQSVLSWNNLVLVSDYATSKVYQDSNEPLIILSASGMMQAGRSVNWATNLLPNANNFIMFCGFAPEESLAGRIKNDKIKSLKIGKKTVNNKCGICSLKSFSSHIQREDMLEYYSGVNAEKIALVHGDFKDKCEFANDLQEVIGEKDKTTKVIVINKDMEVLL